MDRYEKLLQKELWIPGGAVASSAESIQAGPIAAPFDIAARSGGRTTALRAEVFGARSYIDTSAAPDFSAASADTPWVACGTPLLKSGELHVQAIPSTASMRCEDLARVYGPKPQQSPRRTLSRPSSANTERRLPASHARLRTLAAKDDAAHNTPTGSFLRLCGLGQYAYNFADAGLACLSELGRLQDGEVIDVLEGMQLYPGHKARLLRAVTALRQAAILGGRAQTGRTRDEVLMEKLCEKNDLLLQQRGEHEAQCRVLEEENQRVILEVERCQCHVMSLEELVNAQSTELADLSEELRRLVRTARRGSSFDKEHEWTHDVQNMGSTIVAELEKAHKRVTDLEGMFWNQAEQVKFLADQLQHLVGEGLLPASAVPVALTPISEPAPLPTSAGSKPLVYEKTMLSEEFAGELPIKAAVNRARPASASLEGLARRIGRQDCMLAEVYPEV